MLRHSIAQQTELHSYLCDQIKLYQSNLFSDFNENKLNEPKYFALHLRFNPSINKDILVVETFAESLFDCADCVELDGCDILNAKTEARILWTFHSE